MIPPRGGLSPDGMLTQFPPNGGVPPRGPHTRVDGLVHFSIRVVGLVQHFHVWVVNVIDVDIDAALECGRLPIISIQHIWCVDGFQKASNIRPVITRRSDDLRN